ncbi:hypothetical protein [Streptomyces sp. NPDC017673]|uniref:hypothetical protein n=1 Tax=unclassified Streptomyces TaxID=2593676 RepID=UPI003797324F
MPVQLAGDGHVPHPARHMTTGEVAAQDTGQWDSSLAKSQVRSERAGRGTTVIQRFLSS